MKINKRKNNEQKFRKKNSTGNTVEEKMFQKKKINYYRATKKQDKKFMIQ